jgi:hypothetical protein
MGFRPVKTRAGGPCHEFFNGGVVLLRQVYIRECEVKPVTRP